MVGTIEVVRASKSLFAQADGEGEVGVGDSGLNCGIVVEDKIGHSIACDVVEQGGPIVG